MQARLIAYVPEAAAIARMVEPGRCLSIGRNPDSDLQIDHPSVSREHAQLQSLEGGGWRLVDLQSKNGSFVNGARVAAETLAGASWLRFGDVHCEFAALDSSASAAQARAWEQRRTHATLLTQRIDALERGADTPGAGPASQALLEHSLRAVLELAQCSRGYVLADEEGRYCVANSVSLDPQLPAGVEFGGSLSAVAQALRTRQPVVYNDIGQEAWLASRDSVASVGLRTLVALPLLDGERTLGAIYADRRDAGPPLTTLDVELLQAFAERCALWIAARQAANPATGATESGSDRAMLFPGPGATQ